MAVDEAFDCRLLKRQDSEVIDLVTDMGGTAKHITLYIIRAWCFPLFK